MIIARARQPISIKIMLSMETGLRPVELCNLKVKDLDLEKRLIYPTTAKHGNPRILKISQTLTSILKEWIIKNNLNPNDKLFKGDADYYGKKFRETRNKLAKKLKDPSIKNIRLYDLRHYRATTLYDKTRDILLVKQQLGHKKIETTLRYTQLIHFNEEEEYTCKTATTVKQAQELIEHGFQYITEIDGTKLFRKRK